MASSITKPLGFHVSPEVTFEFKDRSSNSSGEKVTAQLGNSDVEVPVTIPQINFSGRVFEQIADRMRFLLRNRHFQLIYTPPVGKNLGEVTFKPTDPQGKVWEKFAETSLPQSDSLQWICRQDETISYVFVNTITTWDWKDGRSSSIPFNTTRITALAELLDGSLMIGDEKGNLLIQNVSEPIISGLEAVANILHISKTLFLVEGVGDVVIIDVSTGIKCKPIKCSGWVEVLDNNFIVLGSTIVHWNVEKQEVEEMAFFRKKESDTSSSSQEVKELEEEDVVFKKVSEKEPGWQKIEISTIQALSSAFVMIIPSSKDQRLLLWNIETNSCKKFHDKTISQEGINKKFYLLDEKIISYELNSSFFYFFSIEEQATKKSNKLGKWGITASALLSDGSIMVATGTTPSGIYVISKDSQIVFSSEELIENKQVKSIKELVDGSVAIEFYGSLVIIQPKKNVPESKDYQIEKIKLDIKYDPSKLDLYLQLAELYADDEEKQYQAYLAGLEAAIKIPDLYSARRFYAKTRRLKSESIEPYLIFLSLLEKTSSIKQKNQVALDFYHLQEKLSKPSPLSSLLESNSNKECKKRLIIGEGNFSYVEALIAKHERTHKKLAKAIVATEFLELQDQARDRVVKLMEQGVTVLFGIDGQKIHQIFKGQRFKRIHWNCPFGDPRAREEFKTVIPNFFQSCSHIQLYGDRVQVTLVQEKDGYWKKRQSENPIVKGATFAGYRLIRKRVFGTERYPEYKHTKTGKDDSYGENLDRREFVFEKTKMRGFFQEEKTFPILAESLRDSHEKKYHIKTDSKDPKPEDYYFECSTDEESSDYYESD